MGCAERPTINGLQMTTIVSRGINGSGQRAIAKARYPGGESGHPSLIQSAASGVLTSSTVTQTRLDGFQNKYQPVCQRWLEIRIGNTTPVNAVTNTEPVTEKAPETPSV